MKEEDIIVLAFSCFAAAIGFWLGFVIGTDNYQQLVSDNTYIYEKQRYKVTSVEKQPLETKYNKQFCNLVLTCEKIK